MELVKCQDCGFLAIRHPEDRELVSPAATYRTEGFQGIPPHVWPDPQPVPNCSVRAHPIHTEPMVVHGDTRIQLTGEAPGDFSVGDGNDDTEKAILSIIGKPRICKAFYPWVEGFSPKEHYETREAELRRDRDRKWRIVELAVAFITGALTATSVKVIDHLLSSGNGNPPMP